MWYMFDLCPKCKDKLVERIVDNIARSESGYCPDCGEKMDEVFYGDKKAETAVYKITLNRVQHIKKKYLNVIMRMENLSEKEALEKLDGKDSISFEGDLLRTFLNLELIDEMWDISDYVVTPPFPYTRIFIQRCDCGEKAVYKVEKINEEKFRAGFFCEKCGEYVWYDVCDKVERDLTPYQLKLTLKAGDEKGKQEIMRRVNESDLYDKEVHEDEIVIRDQAKNIEVFLEIAKNYDIAYEIDPPYPHKILMFKEEGAGDDIKQLRAQKFKEEWTEDDIKQLIAHNPGLTVSVEEMNALNEKENNTGR